MKREDYYRSNNEPNKSYQDPNPNRSSYNNYNNYGQQPQPPYYPPRRHHIFMWVIVIILCLGFGWLAADHFIGDSNTPTTVNRSTTINKTTNDKQPQQVPQQPKVAKLEREMNRLNVSAKDQQAAISFYQRQNTKDQNRMNKMIDIINKVVPSNTLKKQALNWILK